MGVTIVAKHRKPVTVGNIARARARVALAKHRRGQGVDNLPPRVVDIAQWEFKDADREDTL